MYKTYVMHYTPLKDRREFIDRQLLNQGISDAEFITEFDKEDLTEQDLSAYNKDKDLHKELCEISRKPHGLIGESPYSYEELSPSSISLNLKHLEAFRRFWIRSCVTDFSWKMTVGLSSTKTYRM